MKLIFIKPFWALFLLLVVAQLVWQGIFLFIASILEPVVSGVGVFMACMFFVFGCLILVFTEETVWKIETMWKIEIIKDLQRVGKKRLCAHFVFFLLSVALLEGFIVSIVLRLGLGWDLLGLTTWPVMYEVLLAISLLLIASGILIYMKKKEFWVIQN